MKQWIKIASIFLLGLGVSIPHAQAATSIPFTINMTEAVNVDTTGGTPRIAVDVGGVTRYASYTSGTGTSALTFTYQLISGDIDLDGISLSSPVDLNGGTIKDLNGNDLSPLTFTPPITTGILVNAAVPSGYTASFSDKTVTNINKTAMGFTLTYNKASQTYNYTISSSGGGTPLTGSGTTTGAAQTVNGINVTSLPDGKLTLSVTITDSLGGVGIAATDIVPKAVLDTSLVGHWTFDTNDISGTTAFDRSGQGNNGTIINAATQTTGKVGGVLNFNGGSKYVTIPDSANLDLPNTVTISFWINPSASYVGYAVHPINKWTGTANANYVMYYFGTTSGADRQFRPYVNRGGTWTTAGGSYTSTPGTWINFAWTYNSATGGQMYINGSPVGSLSGGGVLATNNAALNICSSSAGFPGLVDDVRIYNRTLTPTEITTLYNAEQ